MTREGFSFIAKLAARNLAIKSRFDGDAASGIDSAAPSAGFSVQGFEVRYPPSAGIVT